MRYILLLSSILLISCGTFKQTQFTPHIQYKGTLVGWKGVAFRTYELYIRTPEGCQDTVRREIYKSQLKRGSTWLVIGDTIRNRI
jgi:hypothetical protein